MLRAVSCVPYKRPQHTLYLLVHLLDLHISPRCRLRRPQKDTGSIAQRKNTQRLIARRVTGPMA